MSPRSGLSSGSMIDDMLEAILRRLVSMDKKLQSMERHLACVGEDGDRTLPADDGSGEHDMSKGGILDEGVDALPADDDSGALRTDDGSSRSDALRLTRGNDSVAASGGLSAENGGNTFHASVGVMMGPHTISDLLFLCGNPNPRGGPHMSRGFQVGPLNIAFHQVTTLALGSDRSLVNDLNGSGAGVSEHGLGGGTVGLSGGDLSNNGWGGFDMGLLDDDPFAGGGSESPLMSPRGG
jgi:hypothetical protein